MPSTKKASSASRLRFSKGSTATEGRAPADAAAGAGSVSTVWLRSSLDRSYHQKRPPPAKATSTNVTRLGYPQDLCDKSEIRHTQAQQRVFEVRGAQGGLVRSGGYKLLD